MSFAKDTELLAGTAGAVLAAEQIMKSIDSEKERTSHLVKAGLSAAVAIGAFELLREGKTGPPETTPHEHSHRRRSESPTPKHHSST